MNTMCMNKEFRMPEDWMKSRENKGTEREAPVALERKSVFRDVRIKANLDLMFLVNAK